MNTVRIVGFVVVFLLLMFGSSMGETIFHSDGTYSQRVGNTMFHSDGTNSQRVGNTIFHSDGTTSQIIK